MKLKSTNSLTQIGVSTAVARGPVAVLLDAAGLDADAMLGRHGRAPIERDEGGGVRQ